MTMQTAKNKAPSIAEILRNNDAKNAKADVAAYAKLEAKVTDEHGMFSDAQAVEELKTFAKDVLKTEGTARTMAMMLDDMFGIGWQDLKGPAAKTHNLLPLWNRMEAIRKEVQKHARERLRAGTKGQDAPWNRIKAAARALHADPETREPQTHEEHMTPILKRLYKRLDKDNLCTPEQCELMDMVADMLVKLKVDVSSIK